MPVRHSLPVALLSAALTSVGAAPPVAHAQEVRLGNTGPDSPTRVVPRLTADDAAHQIVTGDGRIALVLSDDGVALQFTDHGLAEALAPKPISAGDDRGLARLLERLIHEGVRGLLDHAIEYPLFDLADARYEHGRLFFVRHNGERVFHDVRVDDEPVMEMFDPRDARDFVERFQRAKGRVL